MWKHLLSDVLAGSLVVVVVAAAAAVPVCVCSVSPGQRQ